MPCYYSTPLAIASICCLRRSSVRLRVRPLPMNTRSTSSCHHNCRSTNSRAYGKFAGELSGAANSCYSLTSGPGSILDNTGCPLDGGEQGLHFVPHCRNCLNEQEHCIYQVNR